jgi:hypothetical protein
MILLRYGGADLLVRAGVHPRNETCPDTGPDTCGATRSHISWVEARRTTTPGGGLVPHTGFEPVISALRGRCPGPLDECGAVGPAGAARPVGMIPAARSDHQTPDLARPARSAVRHPRGIRRRIGGDIGRWGLIATASGGWGALTTRQTPRAIPHGVWGRTSKVRRLVPPPVAYGLRDPRREEGRGTAGAQSRFVSRNPRTASATCW